MKIYLKISKKYIKNISKDIKKNLRLISFWHWSSSVMLQPVLSTGLAEAKAARQAKASKAKTV